ncbi:MAG: MBL fold metallo-hydrolase [Anaerolineae bacterium]|nr:MBL fold metallo-hydrolase [Anaerolineae bacterium]
MSEFYRFNIGDFQCLAVNDGNIAGNTAMLFANAPEDELHQLLRHYQLQPDHLPSTLTCLLVKTPTNVVLVDTGFGAGQPPGGQVLSTLQAAGFQPEDIDTVILTHAHPDHVGGGVDNAGRATFPEATYYMGRVEWDFWTGENAPKWAAGLVRGKLQPLASQLKMVEAETEIVPGVRVVAAPGHTIGHMAVEVESAGEVLLDLVDTTTHPIQIEYPEWYGRIDQLPEQTVATRLALYQRAVEKNALALAFHFPPFPSLGRISKSGERWQWQPWPG